MLAFLFAGPLQVSEVPTEAIDPSLCTAPVDRAFKCVWERTFTPGEGFHHWMLPHGITMSVIAVRIVTDHAIPFLWGFCIEPMPKPGPTASCPSAMYEKSHSPSASNRTMTLERNVLVNFSARLNYHFMIHPTAGLLAPAVLPTTFRVEAQFQQVNRTLTPGGHAGTPDDPQLRDAEGDSERLGDITAGWLDQAFLDDGLIDVGLRLPNLRAVVAETERNRHFLFTFDVLGDAYTVHWIHGGPATNRYDGWAAQLFKPNGGPASTYSDIPVRIDFVNRSIEATIPLKAIGNPLPGDLFTNLSAVSSHDDVVPATASDDVATTMVRPFATGGVEVWARMRGEPLSAPVASSTWTSAPLAEANLPFTLLLLGVVTLGTAGGAGFITMRRRLRRLASERPHAGSVEAGALVLGKYRVERELGAGSGGRVFLAHDVRMQRPVVLKTVAEKGSTAALREARAGAAIDHPNVVKVYDVEDLGTHALLVMEYVDGGSLETRIRASGPLAEGAFLRLADDLLSALAAVHATGSVHRDVKPSNVLLTRDGRAKLSDFGVARLPGFEATLGDTSVGSIRYMAPEQARGRRATPASDLYSAGLTLYEALLGKPYVGDIADETAVEMQRRVGAAAGFDRVVGSPALAAWFARALAPMPSQRFEDSVAMRDALHAALA